MSKLKCDIGKQTIALMSAVFTSFVEKDLVFISDEAEKKCLLRAYLALKHSEETPDFGFVYFASTENFPSMLKVGFTRKKNPWKRLKSMETSLPSGNMHMVRCFLVRNPHVVEQQVHKMMSAHRVSPNREWFRVNKDLESVFQWLKTRECREQPV